MDTLSLQQVSPWLISLSLTVGSALVKITLITVLALIAMRFLKLGLQHVEGMVARAGRTSRRTEGRACS